MLLIRHAENRMNEMIARYEVSLDLTEASSFFGVIVHERVCDRT